MYRQVYKKVGVYIGRRTYRQAYLQAGLRTRGRIYKRAYVYMYSITIFIFFLGIALGISISISSISISISFSSSFSKIPRQRVPFVRNVQRRRSLCTKNQLYRLGTRTTAYYLQKPQKRSYIEEIKLREKRRATRFLLSRSDIISLYRNLQSIQQTQQYLTTLSSNIETPQAIGKQRQRGDGDGDEDRDRDRDRYACLGNQEIDFYYTKYSNCYRTIFRPRQDNDSNRRNKGKGKRIVDDDKVQPYLEFRGMID